MDKIQKRSNTLDVRKKSNDKEPEVPENLALFMLNKEAIARLRTLPKELAKQVGLHIVAAQHYLDIDLDRAFEHAMYAVSKASRIDITRETLGIAAYRMGNYNLAKRELETAARMNGSTDYMPMILDCERGLGNVEKVANFKAYECEFLDDQAKIECLIVLAAAKADMGTFESALALLNRQIRQKGLPMECKIRLLQAKSYVYEKMGRHKDVIDLDRRISQIVGKTDAFDSQDYIIYDLEDDVFFEKEKPAAGPRKENYAKSKS